MEEDEGLCVVLREEPGYVKTSHFESHQPIPFLGER